MPDPSAGGPQSVDLVAEAVIAVPGVARLGGPNGVATYLPGRRVEGIRLEGGSAEIHVVARWGAPLGELAEGIRDALNQVQPTQWIDVVIEDVDLDEVPDVLGALPPAGGTSEVNSGNARVPGRQPVPKRGGVG